MIKRWEICKTEVFPELLSKFELKASIMELLEVFFNWESMFYSV